MAELRAIYERGVLAVARRALAGNEPAPGATVEIVKLEDGFALQFRFKE